ncbi:MAG: type VI secretion system ATPase TssH, partial [Ilumatobacteraceae bacterium]|nr:type VI secretion system ATPase TssH [Ilumatobacteraceae bacterium]
FRSLTAQDLGPIVEIQLQHLVDRMADRRIALRITSAARVALATKGFDPTFGARPLKRLIQTEITNRAAVLILEGKVSDGGAILVDVVDDALTLVAQDASFENAQIV